MKLLEQILSELGADTLKSFSVVPDFGGYFRSVKGVSEYSPEKIVLSSEKKDFHNGGGRKSFARQIF